MPQSTDRTQSATRGMVPSPEQRALNAVSHYARMALEDRRMLYALEHDVRAIRRFYPDLLPSKRPSDDGTELGHKRIVLFEAAEFCSRMRMFRSPLGLAAALEAQERFLDEEARAVDVPDDGEEAPEAPACGM